MTRRSLLHRNTPMPEEALATLTDPGALLLATAVAVAAGFVKGVSGMALPLVLLTGLSLILPVPVVAAIIAIPALVANVLQARAAGGIAALATFREFWLLNTTLFLTTFASTQLLVALEERTLLLTLGTGAFCLAALQALGPQRELPKRWRKPLELPCALVGGFFGGLSGLWGTVLVIYFVALRLDKEAFIRATGVALLAGSIPYVAGHLQSGILNSTTLPLSAAATAPVLAGLWAGRKLRNHLNLVTFRRIVIAILLVAALNLIRRGI